MRKIRSGALLFSLLILVFPSCSFMDSRKSEPVFKFPPDFYTFQKVSVLTKEKKFTLLAQLERRDGTDKVVFIDSMINAPILTFINANGNGTIKWHIKRPAAFPFDEERLFHLIFKIYDSKYDPEIVKLKDIKSYSGTLFPGVIKIDWRRFKGVEIKIVTEEFECFPK